MMGLSYTNLRFYSSLILVGWRTELTFTGAVADKSTHQLCPRDLQVVLLINGGMFHKLLPIKVEEVLTAVPWFYKCLDQQIIKK